MGSMHTGLEEEKNGFEKLAAYYGERARGEVGLIVTGGIAPNRAGWVAPFSGKLTTRREAKKHEVVTNAVHQEGGKICLQILHTGRYGYHPFAVAPTSIKSPISPFKPWQLSSSGIHRTIRDYARCAALAQEGGYDGVEIMGSEGYLINQFIASKTNKRHDGWGGSYENRIRFPVEIVRKVREAVGPNFIIIYRLSMLDLVKGGSTWDEIVLLAKKIEEAGATIINTGIGWHEARIPTIATMVPRAGFAWVTQRIMGEVNIPLVTTNRINTPEVAEQLLKDGYANMVSMARPFLADPEFVIKAKENRADEINTCIACNQACLDHVFEQKPASCLVNPRACNETELNYLPAKIKKKVAVIGAGPAGLSAATVAAQRGHAVDLYEANAEIGGQFNLAKRIPGKEEFHETIRYFRKQIELTNVNLLLNTVATEESLRAGQYDEIILATGVKPRTPGIVGIDHPKAVSYMEVLRGKVKVGQRVAIIGAGGIGFDVADFLVHGEKSPSLDVSVFLKEWGIDPAYQENGGLTEPAPEAPAREVYLLQRSSGKLGARLGKTTGWIHRSNLRNKQVHMMGQVEYQKIDDQGLHILHKGEAVMLEVDHVVICAGQVSELTLEPILKNIETPVHLIGGAKLAAELDAKRAIDEGARIAAQL